MVKARRRSRQPRNAALGLRYSDVCKLALKLPGVEESTSYGTPALKVHGTLMARLREDGQTLVLRTTMADRARLLTAAPNVLYLTDHYVSAPWILVRLRQIERAFLAELVEEAWRLAAPTRLAKHQNSPRGRTF